MSIEWLTTAPNPRSSAIGFDAGQKGWRLHAIETNGLQNFNDIKRFKAVCGVQPRHGWSLDLFIDEKCKECLKAIDPPALKL